MRLMPRIVALLMLALLAPLVPAQEASRALERIFGDYEQDYLRLNPHEATLRGERRYNAVLADGISAEFLAAERALAQRYLGALDALDIAALNATQRNSVATLRFNLELARERHATGFAAKQALMPLNQFKGLHLELAQLGSGNGVQPFATAADHEAWLARAAQWPHWVDIAIANMRRGITEGVVLPRVLAERVLPQLEAHIVDDPRESVFWRPVTRLAPGTGRDALEPGYRALITRAIVPGYRKLHGFIRDEYLPAARDSVGRSALPDGANWYALDIRANTTLALDADTIHRTGLAQVALLRQEFGKMRERMGFESTLRDFFEHLRTSKTYLHPSAEAALQAYRAVKIDVARQLPTLFGRIPKADYKVRPVEDFRAASAAGGSYQRPDAAGTRPGVFYLNTHDLTRIPTYETMTLSLHEAAPGHHFQIAIATESEQLPDFQRFGYITAFGEGWALYAETLGHDLGVFDDPLQYVGFLHSRLFRANRLVVDTGLHARGWTRGQAIAYFLENSPMSEADATAEVDRYMAWPGQALAYMTGALEIERLRERAGRELGERFDLREFHDEVLGDGIIPLPVLQTKIDRWIEARRVADGN